jgi:hypothetical protein
MSDVSRLISLFENQANPHLKLTMTESTQAPNPLYFLPLGSLFEDGEEARLAYGRLLPLEDEQRPLIRILGQMLIQAPFAEGRAYMAKSINSCATDQEIINLGRFTSIILSSTVCLYVDCRTKQLIHARSHGQIKRTRHTISSPLEALFRCITPECL